VKPLDALVGPVARQQGRRDGAHGRPGDQVKPQAGFLQGLERAGGVCSQCVAAGQGQRDSTRR